jgi:CRISPR/Cas system CMR subunit Cmr6 (Cas7 group RAMP superfamily)
MNEARKLHFAQVCADSFAAIKTTRDAWEKEAQELREKEQRERDQRKLQRLREAREKLEGYLADTEGLAARRGNVGAEQPGAVSTSHLRFFASLGGCETLHAQLQSRLMVNMAGGVMENAGLCLDRFGLPYIPGSAVKGCARRAALAALHEWSETGTQPTGADNPLAPCCDTFANPAEMLAAIARVFGWCEQDWSDQSDKSDFAWACGPNHREHWHTTAPALATRFGWKIADKHRETSWKSLPNFAGSVSFLPAYPVDLGKAGKVDSLPLEVPPLGKLELDVVTVHHKHYYAEPAEPKDVPHSHEKWQRWKRDHEAWEREWGTAPDIEEPVPNVFPAVAPGHVFTFALAPLRGADAQLVQHARTWLATGLSVFGLGAKTNAGYGWFDCSEEVQRAVMALLQSVELQRRKDREEAEAKRKAEEAKEAAEKAEQERVAKAPPHERFRANYGKLADEAFAAQAKKFAEMTDEQRHGFILALKDRRETAKRWAKKKPELLKPWQEHGRKLQPPIELP